MPLLSLSVKMSVSPRARLTRQMREVRPGGRACVNADRVDAFAQTGCRGCDVTLEAGQGVGVGGHRGNLAVQGGKQSFPKDAALYFIDLYADLVSHSFNIQQLCAFCWGAQK